MKKNLFTSICLVSLLLCSTSWAQTGSLKKQYESQIQGNFSKYDDKLAVTKSILALAMKIAEANGIDTQVENLTTETGELKTYPALRILPTSTSIANNETQYIEKNYGGMKLYLSPYDLKRSGSNAFFKPDGSMIGVPRDFIYNLLSESYQHEKMHATTYLHLIQGSADTYAGVFKLVKGETLSDKNNAGYNRFASVDEFLTTIFSAKETCTTLYGIYKKNSSADFLKDMKNEDLLSEILFSLENGIGLSAQAADLAERANKALTLKNVTVQKQKISLGSKLSKDIFTFKILVESYERKMKPGGGGGYSAPVANGAELSFYALYNDEAKLKLRLQEIAVKGKNLEEQARITHKKVGVRIMYADLLSTNMENLYQACANL
ncbi:MAG: hypothetical protein ACOYL6_19080 [Bacteriovoracaceae bacterium]